MLRFLIALAFTALLNSTLRAQQLYFPGADNNWQTIDPASLSWRTNYFDTLTVYLAGKHTKGFIILKDGKIAKEEYFGTFTQDSLWYWASAGKTITSVLTGIANEKGLLQLNQKSSDFLGNGWTSLDAAKEALITVRHQVTMTTGLEDDVPDTDCNTPSCLIYKADAGTRWAYHNAPYLLLHNVLEAAGGKNINTITYQWMNDITGMKGLWYDHVYYSKTRDAARFGLMILARGNWNGTQVIADGAYFQQMVNTSQDLNKSYGYLWWLNGKGSFMLPQSQLVFPGNLVESAPPDMFMAMGKNDQRIYVIPSQNLVVVRFGKDTGEIIAGPDSFDTQLWNILQKLMNLPDAVPQQENSPDVNVYPNPAGNYIQLSGITNAQYPAEAQIINSEGRQVMVSQFLQPATKIDITTLPSGIYVLIIKTKAKDFVLKFVTESK